MTASSSTVKVRHAKSAVRGARAAAQGKELASARAPLNDIPRRGKTALDHDSHPGPSRSLKRDARGRAPSVVETTESARFRSMLMDIPAGILLLRGRDMVAELANPLYLTLIGRKDIIGQRLQDFLPELVEQGFLALLQRVYDSGEPFTGNEVPVRLDRRGDGQVSDAWFTFTYQPVCEPGGGSSGVLVHVIEVTENVLAHQKVQDENRERRQAEERLLDEIRERAKTEEELRAKLSIIRRQEAAIFALTTPILEIWDGVIALPVIGTVDSSRAGKMMEGLLGAINRTRAHFAVLDLTGVEVIDTQAAAHLVRLVRAASLLGSRCLISGIKPEVAQTMVALNVEIAPTMSFSTLEAALRYALRHLKAPGV